MQSVRVTFQDGVFRPLDAVSLPDGTPARVEFEAPGAPKPWMRFCGTITVEEAAAMNSAIEETFEQVSPDDWK